MAEATQKLSDDIKTLAEMALSNARRQLEATGTLDVRVAVQYPGGRLAWLPIPAHLKNIMNDGDQKALFFGIIREFAERTQATAVVFVTDAWFGEPTEKQLQMGRENREELKRLGESLSFDEFVEQGLATRRSAVLVSVQTAECAHLVSQFYDRIDNQRRIIWGQRQERVIAQADFMGRQKMFGAEVDERGMPVAEDMRARKRRTQ
jgi:hypothetical protein